MDSIFYIVGFAVTWLFLMVCIGSALFWLYVWLIRPIINAPKNAANSCQLELARSLVMTDLQFLAHNSVARAICERHLQILQGDWDKQVIKDISRFRNDIGLNPGK